MSLIGNRLLDALPRDIADLLIGQSKLLDLPQGTRLFEPDEEPRHVWCLTRGVASFTYISKRGVSIELATVGNEGVVGAFALLGNQRMTNQCAMQLNGSGYRVPLAAFQAEFKANVELRSRVLDFVEQQMNQAYQIVACNRLHQARERFARWLLMVQDRVQADALPMTQESLANMLGTRRTTVVQVAAELQRAGAIDYRRGIIQIADRTKLIRETCECYVLLKERFDELYATPTGK